MTDHAASRINAETWPFWPDIPTSSRLHVGEATNRPAFSAGGVRIKGLLKTTSIMAQNIHVPVSAQATGRSETFDTDSLYAQLVQEYGAALARIARAHKADDDLRRDLLQELHVALWRSLGGYDRRCSHRTWVYRVAHNTAATHVTRRHRSKLGVLCKVDELDVENSLKDPDSSASGADYHKSTARLYSLIRRLAPLDRQIILLYLEDLDAAEIATTAGLSPGNVATKVHRIKRMLTSFYHSKDPSHE
jgi:RNA polymerase sigma-70 factor (ECF subfamily)